jgi:hypothetical protein
MKNRTLSDKRKWPMLNNGARDGRFSITKEFAGNFNNIGQPDFVFRFCDEFMSSHMNYEDALQAAKDYHNKRQKDLKS